MKRWIAALLLAGGLIGWGAAPASADPACQAVRDNMGDSAGNRCENIRERCNAGEAVACLLILVP